MFRSRSFLLGRTQVNGLLTVAFAAVALTAASAAYVGTSDLEITETDDLGSVTVSTITVPELVAGTVGKVTFDDVFHVRLLDAGTYATLRHTVYLLNPGDLAAAYDSATFTLALRSVDADTEQTGFVATGQMSPHRSALELMPGVTGCDGTSCSANSITLANVEHATNGATTGYDLDVEMDYALKEGATAVTPVFFLEISQGSTILSS